MNARKRAALQAMAEQRDSPEEAAIARDKLALLEAREPDMVEARELRDWRERERREAERQRSADEATRAELVRRWEHGEFAGVNVRTSATTEIRYRKPKS